ncbi:MAG: nucleotidyl transferase AbiEii/AbiGii toxin family protein [Candidatus Omnitrophica bacterium]|nr:nucleotidyl transferase AbiEii/AbiGii toxin family protein [Candidatus Omnitrophota bacterium]
MKKKISYIKDEQKKIMEIVTKKFKNYYLTGGTGLGFYFDHRFSEDLDFFTQEYKKEDPDRIMNFISQKTGFDFKLDAEQDDPKLVPMKVYFLELKHGCVLKIDFVQDFMDNIKKVKGGLHSIEDIYVRKLGTVVGTGKKKSIVGRTMSTGRQTAKDLFDIYYLSENYKKVSDFFLKYFSIDRVENFIAWYRGFNRMNLKLELLDLVEGVDTGKALRYLDDEILKNLPDKLR